MNCENIIDLLSAYIDDELTVEERHRVASHLDICPDCEERLTALRNAVSMVRDLGELEVPGDVSRALRKIAEDEPAKAAKNWLLPLRYLVATGAVAAIALVSVLSLFNTDLLNNELDKRAVTGGAQNALSNEQERGGPTEAYSVKGKETSADRAKSDENIVAEAFGLAGAPKGATGSYKAYDEAQSMAEDNGEQLARKSPSDPTSGPWPVVLVSKKSYDAASAKALLDDIHRETDGMYSTKSAKDRRAQITDELIERVTAQGGDGESLRGPINSLTDQTGPIALPIYLETARFNNRDCLLVAIKWGTGDNESTLNKTSIYVTDPSGRDIMHRISK